MSNIVVKQYLTQLKQRYQAGGATEHSYRGDLENLLKELVQGIKITNEPKRLEFGAPDYVIKRKDIPIGYIEAKDIGVDLNKVEKSDQMERYLKSLDNFILTDYLEFRFFRYGEKIKEIKIASASGKFITYPDLYALFIDYINEFCEFEGQTITSAEKLSKLMAKKARIMEEVLLKALKTDHDDNTLRDQFKAFQDILIHDLTEESFADIYAQTITYGMFGARLHDPNLETFSRFEASQLIPKSNPFLRKLFQYIAGYDLDDRIAWIVDALADVFRVTDVALLIKNLGDVTKQNDPMIHLYETFLAEYDPKLRKKRGVWYTPEPIVNFIVRAVDDILKSEFNLTEGLADNSKIEIKVDVQGKKEKQEVHRVQILDPATGTGTFLSEVVKVIYQRYKDQQGIWNDYVENHLVPRLNGFELLMAPYAMAHLKLDLLLTETGYKPTKDQRLRIFLTNALEEHHPDTGTIFASWLSQEANDANYVKRDTPVMVVLGNPPYSISSSNKGEWIQTLLNNYKEGLYEKKINIDDDYIKFIRYGQHFIDRNSEGILAYISNNSFLDGVTHRQMRKSLLESFNKIFIINLHGNVMSQEKTPDGQKDENVFDIQQGVSINIFIKKKLRSNSLAKLSYFDFFGPRDTKYKDLFDKDIETLKWEQLKVTEPYYFFVKKDLNKKIDDDKGFSLSHLFFEYCSGVHTKRDKLTVSFSGQEAKSKIEFIRSNSIEDIRSLYKLPKDGRDWTIKDAKNDLLKNPIRIENILYRPFDDRKIIYTGKTKGIVAYPRYKIMKNILEKENLGLCIMRQFFQDGSYSHVFITNSLIDERTMYSNRGGTYFFPLYIYESHDQMSLMTKSKKHNLNKDILERFVKILKLDYCENTVKGKKFSALDILDYIYALLHSPSYREKYKEFLKIDFPRIRYPQDKDTFWNLVKLGEELRQIHLLESLVLDDSITTYPEDGSNEVEKINYDNGKVWINHLQYFDNVPQVAWEFYIGGYQPAQKWLKDRKGRVLGFDDVKHYHKIIKALVETDRIMKEIDKVTAGWI